MNVWGGFERLLVGFIFGKDRFRRMRARKTFAGLLVATLVMSHIPAVSTQAATKVKLNHASMTLQVKQKKSIKLIGTKKKITWSTSNKKIATVKKTGKNTAKITGIKAGTCKVKAKVAKKVYTCKVTVKKKSRVVPTAPAVQATENPVVATATPTAVAATTHPVTSPAVQATEVPQSSEIPVVTVIPTEVPGGDSTSTPEVTSAPTQLPEVTGVPTTEPQATEDVLPTEAVATEMPAETEEPEVTPEITPEVTDEPRFLHTEGKNADSIAELEKIIDTQTVSGSAIATDFDSEQYAWSESGELLKLTWSKVGLSGTIELKNCAQLQDLDCSGNQLESVNVKECKQLQCLNVSQNQLTDLQVTACDKLEYLDCMNQDEFSGIITLDLTGCVALKKLYCTSAGVETLQMQDCAALQECVCSVNNLSGTLDFSNKEDIRIIACAENRLNAVNVSGCKELVELRCGENRLSTLDLASCANLEELYCDSNYITELNVDSNVLLRVLSCSENGKLDKLNLRNNTKLIRLECEETQIKKLDVSMCDPAIKVEAEDEVEIEY